MWNNGERFEYSKVLDVLIPPLVACYSNEVLSDLVKERLQGQIHIWLASTILEEARKITDCTSTLNDMRTRNDFSRLTSWLSF